MHYNKAKANTIEQKDPRRKLRSNMTSAEPTLWRALKERGAGGLKFRRQQGIGPFILDFYCPERRLCVELDGSSHNYRYDYDEQRTAFLRKQGIRVLRFSNEQVFSSIQGVVAEIVRKANENTDPTPTPPLQGRGMPADRK
jgi:very-short-patch-repair endonuclease